MSGESSSKDEWFSLLEPGAQERDPLAPREDDPRLGEIVEFWRGDMAALKPRRGVIVGFPQDEGVRRNQGRSGAAAAPNEIRRFLYRLTPWDGSRDTDLRANPPLDAGNVRIEGSLEESQQALAEVVAGILTAGAVPIVLGGGHETAYGHFLGYVSANIKQRIEITRFGQPVGYLLGKPVAIINMDAHLDVRPCTPEGGHSGSPFRQALEHPTQPLPGANYACLGAQSHCVSREHLNFLEERGGVVYWCDQVCGALCQVFADQLERLCQLGQVPDELAKLVDGLELSQCPVYVTIDADVVRAADVPGVSAPNVSGLSASEVLAAAFLAGQSTRVSSLDLVEINPLLDRDGQSSRWGALLIWHFLIGLANREFQSK